MSEPFLSLPIAEGIPEKRARFLFRVRSEKARVDDEQLAATQSHGVLSQKRFMQITGNKLVAALAGTDNFTHVDQDNFVISLRTFEGGIERATEPGCISPAYTVLAPSKEIEPTFFQYLLKSQVFISHLQTTVTGIRDGKSVKFENFANIVLPVPDLATQRQIADFLDRETARIDLLIEKKQRFIETLSESRLTAAPSVIRAFGGPAMKETPDTFDINFDAKGWSVGRVKHVVKLMTSGSRGWSDFIQDDGELFLQSGNIGRRNEIVLSDAKRIIPQTDAEARRTRLNDADTLVCITGGRTGAVGFLEAVPETAYVNQHICLLRPNPKKIFPKMLAQSLYSEIGQRQFSFFQYGLKQGLGFSQVGEVRLPIPPQDLQEKISSEIDKTFERIGRTQSLQERSIDRLKEYRSALITAAVTGQIDVTTYTKSGTPDRRFDAIQEEMLT